MSNKLIVSADGAQAVYDDRWVPIMEALGKIEISRATDVEYSPDSRQWVARYRPTGQVIAAGPLRAEVIHQEVEWLEKEVIYANGRTYVPLELSSRMVA